MSERSSRLPALMVTVQRVCAWCRVVLGSAEGELDPRFAVTHGICCECWRSFDAAFGAESMQQLLDRKGVPVLILEGDFRVVGAPWKSQSFAGDGRHASDGQHAGGGQPRNPG